MSAHGRNLDEHQADALGIYDTPRDLVEAIVGRGWDGRVWNGRDYVQVAAPEPALLAGELAPHHRVLEGHAGTGVWVQVLVDAGHRPELIECMDLDPLAGCYSLAPQLGATATACGGELDFMRCGFLTTNPQHEPDFVLGNPPFNVQAPTTRCERCEGEGQVRKVKGKLVPFKIDLARAADLEHERLPEPRTCPDCDGTGKLVPKPTSVAELHVRRAIEVSARHVVLVLRQGFLGSQVRQFGRAIEADYPFELPLFREHRLRASRVIIPRPRFRWNGSDNAESVVLWWDREWPHDWHEGGWLRWSGKVGP